MGMMRILGWLGDRALNRLAPLDGADWLTRFECSSDVLGPGELLRVAEAGAAPPPPGAGAAGQRTPASPCEGAGRPIPAFTSSWGARWADLPVVRTPQFWTDDDNDFQSDMTYLRGLVTWLVEQGADGLPVHDIPNVWSEELKQAHTDLRAIRPTKK
jgi:hypothetical protein